jgi:triacylglycerol lipase
MGPLLSQVRSFGLEFTPQQIEKIRGLYSPHVPRPTPDIATVTRDAAYGPHARHRLDVFSPVRGAGKAPVIMFVHGGGFIQGDKGAADAPFFNNVGAWAVRNGFVGVTMTYRYAPDHIWPAGSRDVAAAVRWIRDNIAAHGGDPERLVLMGHSAGGAHVAGYIGHPELRAEAEAHIKGAILASGIYDVEHAERNTFQTAYYGVDATVYPSQSSLPGLAVTSIPLLLTLAELDPADFHGQAALAVQARTQKQGAWPSFLYMRGHNHISPIMQIGCAEDTLGPVIAEMMAGPRGWVAA